MSKDANIRDVQADYMAAMIEEYNSYAGSGRKEDAAHVAMVLKYTFDYDVNKTEKVDKPAEPPVERAVPTDEPETPEVKRGPGRPRKNPPE